MDGTTPSEAGATDINGEQTVSVDQQQRGHPRRPRPNWGSGTGRLLTCGDWAGVAGLRLR
jgi:hypothetical protein